MNLEIVSQKYMYSKTISALIFYFIFIFFWGGGVGVGVGVGAYSRWAIIRGWALNRINTVYKARSLYVPEGRDL